MTHYHIIGIGGAGMSAIAHVLLDQGHRVSGSDPQQNAQTTQLEQRGARVYHGHRAEHVAGAELVVATSAVKPGHVEIKAAQAAGIPVQKRADLWREWSRERPVVAVAGTHGKTTTTALIALMLLKAGRNPGFLIGADVPAIGRNAQWGNAQAPLVIEADEYDRTFLSLTPHIAVVTNVEWDHVDIYPTPEAYDAAFRDFGALVSKPHHLIVCGDDKGALQVFESSGARLYGIDEALGRDPVSCRRALLDWSATNLHAEADGTHFDLWHYDHQTFATRSLGPRRMGLYGEHNVRNAVGAIAAASMLGLSQQAINEGLHAYSGADRRFQIKGEAGGVIVVDDYAHHPTEVRATLQAARSRFPGRRLVVYLQPHTYSRTATLMPEWLHAFGDADVLRIGDIYAAREQPVLGVSSDILAQQVAHGDAVAVGDIHQAAQQLNGLLQSGDVLLTLGAGDGYKVGEVVLAARREQTVDEL